jgi:hypothetical protein
MGLNLYRFSGVRIKKIAAFGSSYRETNVGAAEGCDLLILALTVILLGQPLHH